MPDFSPWLRFPSPLIEPDVRFFRIRLSDWFHVAASLVILATVAIPLQGPPAATGHAPHCTPRCSPGGPSHELQIAAGECW